MAASTSAAASTSTAADSNNSTCYDVFISHRVPDVRKTFASHLYRSLISYGLRVFLDYEEVQEGENFPCQIKGYISAASLHVAIFSPGYADSQWCLDALVLMLESRAPIIPVFHHVEPTELRRTDGEGVYARSLRNLEKKKRKSDSQPCYDSETIENWRNALSRVADRSAHLDLEAFNGDEGDLVAEIVEVVIRKGVKRPLTVARYPTGLAEKVQDFETEVLLQQCSGRVQILGITGLGGVGKTTLARELFNRERSNYTNSYFLSDVRENAKNSLASLQSQLLKGLLRLELHIENRHAGIGILKKHLSSCKFLLVLDDVDHQDQVFALLPLDVLHQDSLILITSRDKDVLARSGVQESSIYQLSGLDTQRSRELFCSHAFCHPHPLPGFESLVDKFLEACQGLPLSLKVFGGLLYGNTNKSYWESELEALRKTLPHEIQKSLQISYDALDKDEKQFFLDVACFFIGVDRDSAISVWDGSGWNGKRGFQSLLNKCLVEIEVSMEDDYDPMYDQAPAVKMQHGIRMHDHLRDMGRDLANSSGLPCRLWCGTKHMEDLLQPSSEATKVRGIKMSATTCLRSYTDECAFFSRYKMKNLEILDYGGNGENLDSDGGYDDRLKCLLEGVDSPNLLWFRLRNCWGSSLPPYIPMAKLRVLDVETDRLRTLWQEDLQAPSQLRELRISVDNFFKIPKSIRKLKRLERMVLESQCDVEIPEEFCYLRSLKHLVLRVVSLSSLPDSFGNLPRLERIDLSHCARLESLPDSFGNLSSLERINLSHCIGLKSLPESFGNLSTLKYIDLIYCIRLESLPDSFGNLSSLERINLSHCIRLKSLPESFGNLSMLEYIDLSNCKVMGMLPKSFGNLSRLEDIDLCNCNGMETLPDSFGNLSRLEHIDLSGCRCLKRLPDSFGNLSMLKNIDLSDCCALESLPESFGNLSMLENIDLSNCCALESLPEWRIEALPLQIAPQWSPEEFLLYLINLTEWPSAIGEAGHLEKLVLETPFLEALPPSFGNDLRNLKCLELRSCRSLKRLPDSFLLLNQLVDLRVEGCSPELHFKAVEGENETLTDSGGERTSGNLERCLLRLQHLTLRGTEISEVSFPNCVFPDLQCLDISDCPDLVEVTLPNALRTLVLDNCSKLRKIGAPFPTDACANLQDLHIMKCNDLMPNASFHNASFKDLACVMTSRHGLAIKVEISNFSKLRKIGGSFPPGVCPNFQDLSIQRCENLVELEILPTELQHLNIRECRQLVEVDCPNLQPLEIWPVDCQELVEDEGLPNGHIKLQLIDCPKLNTTAMWFYKAGAKKWRKKPRVFS